MRDGSDGTAPPAFFLGLGTRELKGGPSAPRAVDLLVSARFGGHFPTRCTPFGLIERDQFIEGA